MNTMANPEPDQTEASPPAMQQLFFTSAEMPPHHMRGRIPQETRDEGPHPVGFFLFLVRLVLLTSSRVFVLLDELAVVQGAKDSSVMHANDSL